MKDKNGIKPKFKKKRANKTSSSFCTAIESKIKISDAISVLWKQIALAEWIYGLCTRTFVDLSPFFWNLHCRPRTRQSDILFLGTAAVDLFFRKS